MATKVDAEASQQIKKTVNMTSFFQNRLSLTPKKPVPATPAELSEESLVEKEKIC